MTQANGSAVDAAALRRLFNPTSIALVGASDKSQWSQMIFAAIRGWGFAGKLWAVNKRGAPAHGLPGFTSCKQIPEPVDAAYLFAPVEGMLEALADAAGAGIRAVVVLTSGFAEAGEEGARIQADLARLAEESGVAMLGPNSLGYANIAASTCITSLPPIPPRIPGGVGLVSQSGAVIHEIHAFAHQQGVGLSFLCATGNEAQISLADVIDHLVDDEATRVIAVFSETIRKPERFAAVAEKALAARKPIVVLKVGKSQLTAQVAAAHTGSFVGDDRVFDAACRQFGVIRAMSIEDLITTAGLAAQTGPLEKPGVGVVSISGGACGMIADRGEEAGVTFPAFAPETQAALREVLPGYAATLNPFDITGAAIREPALFEKTLAIIGRDPSIGLTLCITGLQKDREMRARMGHPAKFVGNGLRAATGRGLLLLQTVTPVDAEARSCIAEDGIPGVSAGIENTIRSVGKISWWSGLLKRGAAGRGAPNRSAPFAGQRPRAERETLEYLQTFGVPIIPATIARTAEEAIKATWSAGGSVALKIASPDIAHKTEVGGVRLGVEGDEAVAQAFREIGASVRRAQPEARVDGIIVSPMRKGGTELLVGTARDPIWGPVIVVGMGGIWVEVLGDTALRLLPVTRADVLEMLESLRSVKLLKGFRGSPPANLERLADAVVRIGDAALSLGPDLAALEVNPLRVHGDEIEALDALAVWADERPAATHHHNHAVRTHEGARA